MAAVHDPLTTEEILAKLSRHSGAVEAAARMERVLLLDETDSTNRVLLQMAADGAPGGQVVIADAQTAGRGRLGRSFTSPPGMGLYLSYLFRCDTAAAPAADDASPAKSARAVPVPDLLRLTAHTAVAASAAVEQVSGLCPGIKWVNDLLLPDASSGQLKKICGILAQSQTAGDAGLSALVLGIGINVHETSADFPAELREIAASLRMAGAEHVSRSALAAELILAMDAIAELYTADDSETDAGVSAESLLERYRAHSLLPGRDITVIRGETKKSAHALSVEEDYALRVRYEDGREELLRSGDVTLRF